MVDYYFNTVDYMVGTFKTASSPTSGIFVRDVPKISEGDSDQVCFNRSAGTNSLAETTFNISFTEIDRPGRVVIQMILHFPQTLSLSLMEKQNHVLQLRQSLINILTG